MRTVTNKFNLPDSIVAAANNDSYVARGDISCTSLIGAPKVNILRRNFDYSEDITDLIWSIVGSAMHHIMEKADEKLSENTGYKVKNEIQMSLDVLNWQVTGTFDRLLPLKGTNNDGAPIAKMEDYKNTSIWKVMKLQLLYAADGTPYYIANIAESYDWIWQQNIYRGMLYWTQGVEVTEIEIIAILKDYSASKAKVTSDYPYANTVRVVIPTLPFEDIWNYIVERTSLHKEARDIFMTHGADAVPECTPEERWAKPDTYKFYKDEKAVRSLKNIEIINEESMAEASNMIHEWNKLGRPFKLFHGVDTKCEDWCPVNMHCHYYRNKKK